MAFEIYPPELGEMDVKFSLDPRFIFKNLERMLSPGPVSAVFNVKTSGNFPVSVQSLDSKAGIKFKVEEPVKNGVGTVIGGLCYFVAGLEGGKLQFPLAGLRSAESGGLTCDIPKTMSLIQRREDFRVKAPPDRAFKALIFFAVGKEMIGDIVDVSDNGLQLDLRLGATDMKIGTIWTNCSLERLTAKTAKFDLIIRNVRPSPSEASRIRVGCELHQPTKLNLNEFLSTRSAIQSARLNRRINYWYQDVSWC
ncbi:flagellar brake protein [Polynucleobacter sp. MWH-UH2A]|uniref:flagellar brake protein n=1 Tax=Polynucleobacter sp. MWH-UH2A TaxID=1855617 RepID=UPI001BFE9ED1|nr:hypothetical protein [Polynucleobacter sp. MWH-UH2A]QWD64680.1 hypothetical protein IC571_03345 [Polynucleobacter sp. MWH-UH2A]